MTRRRRAGAGAAAAALAAWATGTACAPAPRAARATSTSTPTTPRDDAADVGAAHDTVRVPAGVLVRGQDDAPRPDERPRHAVRVGAFVFDRTLVTRAAFAAFVARTAHVTSAERAGFGMVSEEGMADWTWIRAPGATFSRPFREGHGGGDADAFLRDDAPAVMVSALDAEAYCASRGARLPTEAEWEWAMGGAASAPARPRRFPWGDAPERVDGRLGLNFWQGASHAVNERRDGFVYVSPVRAFPPNALGLHDPVGNVWQWTSTVYRADAYARAARGEPEPAQDGEPRAAAPRVLRGGSWWCGACTCEGYGLRFRGKAAPTAVFSNNGFRCARSLD